MKQGRSLDITTLPPAVVGLLRWARTEETAASGAHRRPAQRFSREVLGGAADVGYPVALLAECLGVSTCSVRSRLQGNGWLAASKVERGAGLPPATMQRWREAGLLSDELVGSDNERFYPAADVVRALGRHEPDSAATA